MNTSISSESNHTSDKGTTNEECSPSTSSFRGSRLPLQENESIGCNSSDVYAVPGPSTGTKPKRGRPPKTKATTPLGVSSGNESIEESQRHIEKDHSYGKRRIEDNTSAERRAKLAKCIETVERRSSFRGSEYPLEDSESISSSSSDLYVPGRPTRTKSKRGRSSKTKANTPLSVSGGNGSMEVPNTHIEKDHTYWKRRKRNNASAKRSRDAKLAKHMETEEKCAALEQENLRLRAELDTLRRERTLLRLFRQEW